MSNQILPDICTICLEVLDINNQSKKIFFCNHCNNQFHKKCIYHMVKFNKSYQKNSLCPICRNEIDLAFTTIPLSLDRISYYQRELRGINDTTRLISINRCRHWSCRILLICSGKCFYNSFNNSN